MAWLVAYRVQRSYDALVANGAFSRNQHRANLRGGITAEATLVVAIRTGRTVFLRWYHSTLIIRYRPSRMR